MERCGLIHVGEQHHLPARPLDTLPDRCGLAAMGDIEQVKARFVLDKALDQAPAIIGRLVIDNDNFPGQRLPGKVLAHFVQHAPFEVFLLVVAGQDDGQERSFCLSYHSRSLERQATGRSSPQCRLVPQPREFAVLSPDRHGP